MLLVWIRSLEVPELPIGLEGVSDGGQVLAFELRVSLRLFTTVVGGMVSLDLDLDLLLLCDFTS